MMTLPEFRAWLDGFEESFDSSRAPDLKQWNKIKRKFNALDSVKTQTRASTRADFHKREAERDEEEEEEDDFSDDDNYSDDEEDENPVITGACPFPPPKLDSHGEVIAGGNSGTNQSNIRGAGSSTLKVTSISEPVEGVTSRKKKRGKKPTPPLGKSTGHC